MGIARALVVALLLCSFRRIMVLDYLNSVRRGLHLMEWALKSIKEWLVMPTTLVHFICISLSYRRVSAVDQVSR